MSREALYLPIFHMRAGGRCETGRNVQASLVSSPRRDTMRNGDAINTLIYGILFIILVVVLLRVIGIAL